MDMGILYIVATPIGNLKDITQRALEVLREADLIVCEDTRETIKLLNHYQISKPLVSYFQHSKLAKIDYIISQLKTGKKVALVTDAGTPGISDPGGKLISLLVDKFKSLKNLQTYSEAEGRAELDDLLTISPVPGPNAAIAALSVSGFPADKFIFMGFPPHKKGREKYFREVAEAKYTVVFYESTHRILKTLEQLKNVFQASGCERRELVVCRELTKQFESIYRGSAEEILKILESDKNNQKGEFVVIVGK
jgi:16S rRNA (cytidine1402-2'-O)-methyltransferase